MNTLPLLDIGDKVVFNFEESLGSTHCIVHDIRYNSSGERCYKMVFEDNSMTDFFHTALQTYLLEDIMTVIKADHFEGDLFKI